MGDLMEGENSEASHQPTQDPNVIEERSIDLPPTNPILYDWLTQYEVHRKPLALITDDTRCTIDGWSLSKTGGTLTCPVCLSIIRNTKTVMKCLHRFCDRCIVDSIRKGRKECPSCRVKIASHRDLRAEPRIDFLLGSVFGDLDKFEMEQDRLLEEMTQELNINPLRQSVEEGLK